jgi:hypothetical protein
MYVAWYGGDFALRPALPRPKSQQLDGRDQAQGSVGIP